MEVYYDASIEGLFTAFFYLYNYQGPISFTINDMQNSFLRRKHFPTELDKFERIKNYLKKIGGLGYFRMFLYVFTSQDEAKEMVMFSVLKASERYQGQALSRQDEMSFKFKKLQKAVSSERHAYLGLLRFKELENGILYAKMKPKNDVLPLLMPHFIKRFGQVHPFMIYDEGRGYGLLYLDGQVEEGRLLDQAYDNKVEYEALWMTFYQAISIEERKNLNLQRSNMPKRYWAYLTEKQ